MKYEYDTRIGVSGVYIAGLGFYGGEFGVKHGIIDFECMRYYGGRLKNIGFRYIIVKELCPNI